MAARLASRFAWLVAVMGGWCQGLTSQCGTQRVAVGRRAWLASGVSWVASPAFGVVANPFEEITAANKVSLEEGVPIVDLDGAIDLISRKQIASVDFLTASGGVSLCELADGGRTYVVIKELASVPRGPNTFIGKLRDAKVPYRFTAFNLEGFATKKQRDGEAAPG
eukprot:CAMPEP_0197406300 /NCGR_PEP_ID=MMETSP1165-20131217/25611_1 /TAXON_ID=284809 /ORGANISM="Chrysocystis fragilis, Strain CCMP3189" /LENGTH=165 /DNA_ID=CAMNT_0042932647 /DNA_START=1 /DNA_END=498 /DNA_ORIENTATION=+